MVVRPAPPPPAWWSCKKLIPGKKLMADREEGWPDRRGWRVGMETGMKRKGSSSRLLASLPDRLGCCWVCCWAPQEKGGNWPVLMTDSGEEMAEETDVLSVWKIY